MRPACRLHRGPLVRYTYYVTVTKLAVRHDIDYKMVLESVFVSNCHSGLGHLVPD
jgi:hypothetical protein